MKKPIYLYDEITRRLYEFPADGVARFIGRSSECHMSTPPNLAWISRQQAEIIHKKHGDIILIPRSKNCETYLNEDPLPINEGTRIYPPNKITLGEGYNIEVLASNHEKVDLLKKARSNETVILSSSEVEKLQDTNPEFDQTH